MRIATRSTLFVLLVIYSVLTILLVSLRSIDAVEDEGFEATEDQVLEVNEDDELTYNIEGGRGEEEEYEDDYDADYNLNEEDRRIEYAKRNYSWPIPDEQFVPNTPGWISMWRKRFRQIGQLEDSYQRYTGYIQAVTSAVVVPNYTQYGFGLTRCTDKELMNELRQAIIDGLPTAGFETRDVTIPGPNQPWFIHRQDLADKVNYQLQSYAEEWSGMKLIPSFAYGLRLYRNESQLLMHLDRSNTHVISFILHIDSSDDAQPWPLVIEDFNGKTHAVTLTSGDLLFYESSKLLHGRPIPLNGSWYCSLFVHYYPADPEFQNRNVELESHYAVPEIWDTQIEASASDEEEQLPRFQMIDVGLTEPDCPNQWCATMDTINWGGPAKDNELLVSIEKTVPTLEHLPFYPDKKTISEEL